MLTAGLIVVLAVFIVLYIARRRARLDREERA